MKTKSNLCVLNNYSAEDFGIMIDSGIVLKKAVCWIIKRIKLHSDPSANEAYGYVFLSDAAKKQCEYFESLSIPNIILYKTTSDEYRAMKDHYDDLVTLFGDNIMHFVGLHYPCDADEEKFYTTDKEVRKTIIGSLYSNALDCYFVELSDRYNNSAVYPLGFILEYAEDVITEDKKSQIKKEVLSYLIRVYTNQSGTENIVNIPPSHLTALKDAKSKFDEELAKEDIYTSQGKQKAFPATGTTACGIRIKHLIKLTLSALFIWAAFMVTCLYCIDIRENIVRSFKTLPALINGTTHFFYSTVSDLVGVVLLLVTLGMLVWLRPFCTLYKAVLLYKRAHAINRIKSYNNKPNSKKISLKLKEGAKEISDIVIVRGESFTKTYTKAFKKYNASDYKCLSKGNRCSYPVIITIVLVAFYFLSNQLHAYEISNFVSSLW